MPSFLKRPSENLDYDFDFSALIPSGDSLQASDATSTVTVPTGLTAGTKTHSASTGVVKQFLSGGTAGATYEVVCSITTTQGRVIVRELTIVIAPSSTVTVAEVTGLLETDLSQDAIQLLIDDAEQDVISRFGEHASQVDDLIGDGLYIFPTRPVSAVTSAVESVGDAATTLSANDYTIENNGWKLRRRADGTNGAYCWAPKVRLTYTPVDDAKRRKRICIDLVRLAVQYSALQSERSGDYSSASVDYQKERESLLRGLRPRSRGLA